jgi:uncharacterized protein (DUF1501 family)
MPWTRRDVLRAGATVAASALIAPTTFLRATTAHAAGAEPVLVVVFLRGGADWLNLVPPHADPRYYAIRPDIAVPRGSVLNLDGFFGFHPELRPLLSHFRGGRLAVVNAFGLPTPTRSHFDAQDFVENGVPSDKTVSSGWIGRYAALAGFREPWAALTIASEPARSMAGAPTSLAMASIAEFQMKRGNYVARRRSLERMAAIVGGGWGRAATNTFDALDTIGSISVTSRATFPSDRFGAALRDLSRLIRARIGVRVAAVDMSGWDHHVRENDALPPSAAMLAEGLDAFVADLGSEIERTLVLVVSEFGRTAFQNQGGGTDHGRGGALLALGGSVRGGRVFVRGGWPGLDANRLVDRRDLAVTTDTRDVFAEALRRHMGVSNLGAIFPGYTPRFLGLLG